MIKVFDLCNKYSKINMVDRLITEKLAPDQSSTIIIQEYQQEVL